MHSRRRAPRSDPQSRSLAFFAVASALALAAACGTASQAPDGGTAGAGNGNSSSGSGGSGTGNGGSNSSGGGSTASGASGSGDGGPASDSGSSSGGGSGSSSGSGGSSGGGSGSSSGSSGSAGMDGGTDSGSDAGAGGDAGGTDPNRRKLLLHDEGLFRLTYVDLGNPAGRWSMAVPDGNDMQLVGGGRVMLGTGNGYEEHDVATGAKVAELTSFAGTLSAHRLRTGNTLLAGVNWQGSQGIVLVEVSSAGTVQRKIVFPAFTYVRLVRETPQGTFLVTSNHTVFEGQADGTVLWQTLLSSNPPVASMNAWKALRLSSGDTVVSAGYAADFQILGADHKVRQTITGPPSVAPYFFGNFQVLANGHFVVANWEGHGAGSGNKGNQLLEFDPQGTLVWSWKQDPAYVSSIQDVIVLDGLDLSRLHVEDTTGVLVPVP